MAVVSGPYGGNALACAVFSFSVMSRYSNFRANNLQNVHKLSAAFPRGGR